MKVNNIFYTSRFAKKFKQLPENVKIAAIKREKVFRKDPTEPSLRTHGLKGKLKGYFSFSIAYHWRIMFKFEKGNRVTFIDVGTHSIYK